MSAADAAAGSIQLRRASSRARERRWARRRDWLRSRVSPGYWSVSGSPYGLDQAGACPTSCEAGPGAPLRGGVGVGGPGGDRGASVSESSGLVGAGAAASRPRCRICGGVGSGRRTAWAARVAGCRPPVSGGGAGGGAGVVQVIGHGAEHFVALGVGGQFPEVPGGFAAAEAQSQVAGDGLPPARSMLVCPRAMAACLRNLPTAAFVRGVQGAADLFLQSRQGLLGVRLRLQDWFQGGEFRRGVGQCPRIRGALGQGPAQGRAAWRQGGAVGARVAP